MSTKKNNKSEYVPAPSVDLKWINTPFAYARLAKDLTLFQQHVLLKVSDMLQGYMSQFFSYKRNMLPDDPNSLFTPDITSSMPTIEIKLSDFGIDKSRYGEIDDAANIISKMTVQAPNIEDDGTVHGYKLFPVFDEITVPKLNDESIVKYNYRVGSLYAHINPKVSAYAFNMRLGYVKHPLQIAQEACQVYSPRIYFIIKHFMKRNNDTVVIPYRELRESLGMIVVNKDTWKPEKELYTQFSRFCMYVLDKAQADIDNMAKRNLIDLTFTYEPVYKGNIKRGDPESIKFIVQQTDLGKYKRPSGMTKAEKMAVTVNTSRRRGRPRKVAEESNMQTSINFDGSTNEIPAIIPDDRVGDWNSLVAEYGQGGLADILSRTRYLGTVNGAFAVRTSDYLSHTELADGAISDSKFRALLEKYVPDNHKKISVSFDLK